MTCIVVPIKIHIYEPEVVAYNILQSSWTFLSNDRLEMGVLQGVPDVRVTVLFQRVKITAQ